MRVGRQTSSSDFLAKVEKLFFAEPPLDEGARIDAGRAVALEIDQVAPVRFIGGMPKMHEAGVVERRRRLEARDVAAELGRFLVGLHHHGGSVPAHETADLHFNAAIPGVLRLRFRRDRVDVGGVCGERQPRPFAPGGGDDGIEDLVDPPDSLEGFHRIQSLQPLVGLVASSHDRVVHRVTLLWLLRKSVCEFVAVSSNDSEQPQGRRPADLRPEAPGRSAGRAKMSRTSATMALREMPQ